MWLLVDSEAEKTQVEYFIGISNSEVPDWCSSKTYKVAVLARKPNGGAYPYVMLHLFEKPSPESV